MNTSTVVRAAIAGLAGTAAMTAVALMGPLVGMPEMNTGAMLAGFMGIPAALGWMAHFMIGAILAIIFSAAFADKLPGSPLIRGAMYGVLPWFILESMLSPMMGTGFFSLKTPAPVLFLAGSLMGHLIYGAVVGAVSSSRVGATHAVAASR